ncbi:MAG TPA: hypothetical protein ENJ04_00935 [Nitrospirae bacterium]|nr:hypothetical protein [Nitrospirota bacterium]
MTDGITVRILGDFGPFSCMGKSITYQVTIGRSTYLIDCGAPIFQQIGCDGLKEIDGIIITHCHDDHKRWFTDLALFNMYSPDMDRRFSLLTSEDIHDELVTASRPSLDRSLSGDSKKVVDIDCAQYTDYRMIGPRAKYRMVSVDEGGGRTSLCITDRHGNVVGPDVAKVVINERTRRPRMLFKDPHYKEWVEPESFYPFSSTVFYEEDRNVFRSPEGFTIEAVKAPVWHGIPCIGIKISTGRETLIFSSDTVNDTELWKKLCTEKREQRLGMSREEFEAATVVYGDINDFIERTWSEERYRAAVRAFDDAVVIHDIAARNSIVHTDYERLHKTSLRKDRVILTHSHDGITSEWVLCDAGKTFRISGEEFFEVVGGECYPMNADVYHKEDGRFFVGYRNDEGRYGVYEKDGLLRLSRGDGPEHGRLLYRVDVYEDISGRYFPRLDGDETMYLQRKDGRVELVEFTADGSRGRIVEDHRGRLLKGCNR